MANYKIIKILSIAALSLLLSCGKESKSPTARFYHNTTSFFNGYYNADQLYKETLEKLESSYIFPEDDFIEVVNYGDETEIKSYEGEFKKMIEKNDVVIFKHPQGNIIDKCRLLNGKAFYYMQNYSLAMQNFDRVLEKFPESEIVPETYLWIAKTFYQMDNREQSVDILEDNLIINGTIVAGSDVRGDLAIFRARLAMDDEEYNDAATFLEDNINYIKPRRRRARAHYLLGQIYEYRKNFTKSLTNFQEVLKLTNKYDFLFRTQMKIARLYVKFQAGQDDDMEVYKYLRKLLRDEKNEENRDQIYYELALLELKKDSLNQALDYLKESIKTNVGNTRQKALSYYKAGQVYFDELQDYPSAQMYYDSAAQVVTEKMPEYKEIKLLAGTLKEYINALTTIHYQDSMLYLASLPEEEVDGIVDAIIAEKKRIEEEKKAKELREELNKSLEYQQALDNVGSGGKDKGGAWYFDNPSLIANGRSQFQEIWGQRKLEDNWRRSNKASYESISTDFSQTDNTVDTALTEQYGDRAQYYKDIPKSEEEIAASNMKIEEAMYQLGQIYSQKLQEPDSAIKTFEGLLDRYDDSDYTLRARYALFQLYKDKENPLYQAQANYILNDHPNSIYAYLIQGKDPNELKEEETDFKEAYRGLFNAYYAEQYYTSLGFGNFLTEHHQESPEINFAKVHYIRGMSYGYLGEKDSLKTILTYVVDNYPEAEVVPVAKETLKLLAQGGPKPVVKEDEKEKKESLDPLAGDLSNPKYKDFVTDVKPNEKIFVLMYIPQDSIQQDQAKKSIDAFNKENFASNRLRTYVFRYTKSKHLLPYINRFQKVEDAKTYIAKFKESELAQEVLKGETASIFYITHSNFKVAYGKKRIEDYIEYYDNIIDR